MAGSSSANDNTSSTLMLKIKANQNMIINLNSSHYNEPIRPMIECLKLSRISKALPESAPVPLVHLYSTYSSAFYNKTEEIVTFEVGSVKTQISKSRFGKLLGFTDTEDLVDPGLFNQSPSPNSFIRWDTKVILLNSRSSQRKVYPLIGTLFSQQALTVQVSFSTPSSMVSTMMAISKHDIHIMTDSVIAVIPTLPTATFVTTKAEDFEFIGSIPMTMTKRVLNDVECVVEYCKKISSVVRPLDQKHQETFDKLENPKKVVKRKGKGANSDTENPTKRPRKLRKLVMSHHSEDEHSDDQHIINPLQDDQGDNEGRDTITDTTQPPPSPPHDPTPKTTPHSSPKPTPNNSPIPNATIHKSPSQSPKQNTDSSPKPQDPHSEEEEEDDVLIYDDQDDLADFIELPFNIHFNASDENAPMTKEQFKELSPKHDLLLQANKAPSNSDWQSQLDAHNKHVETLVTENVKIIGDFSMLMEKSEKTYSNNSQMQKVISGLAKSLKAENEAFETFCSNMKKENSELASSIDTKLEQLKTNLAMENESWIKWHPK
ncbi:hypothetical protein L1887_17839 [Cichorium endivia]|nr:hypothetical protein L1887_17839 [Cichorium endivia]